MIISLGGTTLLDQNKTIQGLLEIVLSLTRAFPPPFSLFEATRLFAGYKRVDILQPVVLLNLLAKLNNI